MKSILVTGGTVFVSKYIAEYFAKKGNRVHVLNRNNHAQPENTILIEGDRNNLGDILKQYYLDIVIDVNSYSSKDIENLIYALGNFKEYIFISSSAVYKETNVQPFTEKSPLGENRFWGKYGTDKIEAEKALLKRVPSAYILRPPYLYGPFNNIYREAFVFECALKNRKFYLPENGSQTLQFFYIHDLCREIEAILKSKPAQHILNVGNAENISIRDWAKLCYKICGKQPVFEEVWTEMEQRKYFSFYKYEYKLDISNQKAILPELISLENGLKESFQWYSNHSDEVERKDYMEYIDNYL